MSDNLSFIDCSDVFHNNSRGIYRCLVGSFLRLNDFYFRRVRITLHVCCSSHFQDHASGWDLSDEAGETIRLQHKRCDLQIIRRAGIDGYVCGSVVMACKEHQST